MALPPAPMPSHHAGRPLKSWRYVGVYGPDLMLCIAAVRIGRTRQSFWAVWDRAHHALLERTTIGGRGRVDLGPATVRVLERSLQLHLTLGEGDGIETICPAGASYAWTRKQAPVRATGTIVIDGQPRQIDAQAVIDDTSAYYPRHTRWRWCAGVGRSIDGHHLAWNLVAGVNDPPQNSERTIWVDGAPSEAPPSTFAEDLSSVDGLCFSAEAVRERRENLILVRSSYRQPFGTFSGELPGRIALAEGYGVMEAHDVHW